MIGEPFLKTVKHVTLFCEFTFKILDYNCEFNQNYLFVILCKASSHKKVQPEAKVLLKAPLMTKEKII